MVKCPDSPVAGLSKSTHFRAGGARQEEAVGTLTFRDPSASLRSRQDDMEKKVANLRMARETVVCVRITKPTFLKRASPCSTTANSSNGPRRPPNIDPDFGETVRWVNDPVLLDEPQEASALTVLELSAERI